jgi:hypothetical protein
MKYLKTFIDAHGKKVRKGAPFSEYDKNTVAHYARHGLIGPTETKPAAPTEAKAEFPHSDPDRKGGTNNPLTEADALADLSGKPRPAAKKAKA